MTGSLRRVERFLLVVGIVCVGYYGYMTAEARIFQHRQTDALRALLDDVPDAPPVAPAAPVASVVPATSRATPLAPGVIALLEVPRLLISSPVVSGDGPAALDVAVGHLPDTPLPWERGNTAFAAHRDGLFRPLRNVRVGDSVRVRTTRGEFTYRVQDTKIVAPDDLSVLAPTSADTLTLITCYPFNYVGHAPKRFIVRAERVVLESRHDTTTAPRPATSASLRHRQLPAARVARRQCVS